MLLVCMCHMIMFWGSLDKKKIQNVEVQILKLYRLCFHSKQEEARLIQGHSSSKLFFISSLTVKISNNSMSYLTLRLPWVIMREYLLKISIQYQADKWGESQKKIFSGLLGENQILQTNIITNSMAESREN